MLEVRLRSGVGVLPARGAAQAYSRLAGEGGEVRGGAAGQDLERERQVLRSPRKNADRVERFGDELRSLAVDAAEAGLQGERAAVGGGADDGAAGLGAESEGDPGVRQRGLG